MSIALTMMTLPFLVHQNSCTDKQRLRIKLYHFNEWFDLASHYLEESGKIRILILPMKNENCVL